MYHVPRDVTRVIVHPSVKEIKDCAFYCCTQLTTVSGGKGLEEIGEGAFGRCTSLHEIFMLSRQLRTTHSGIACR
jgi:hypothetical protein